MKAMTPSTAGQQSGKQATVPGEIWAAPRSWVETVYPGLAYYNQVVRGGHFAAWEEPDLFVGELRSAFRSMNAAARTPAPVVESH